jgi:hypothetical protein
MLACSARRAGFLVHRSLTLIFNQQRHFTQAETHKKGQSESGLFIFLVFVVVRVPVSSVFGVSDFVLFFFNLRT